MQEQVALERAAFEEKIQRLEKQRSELERMDSKTSAARDLRAEIERTEADVLQDQQVIDQHEEALGKRFKSMSQSQ